jgi:hypothetical protein
MTLERFQEKTVEAAVARLRAKGPRRFLVADEVGLGKTVIAREIAVRLSKVRGGLNVLYLCPSLQIAAQNREKFLSITGLDGEAFRYVADRMTLAVERPTPKGMGIRVSTFTPETSLPGWRPGVRTGRMEERAVLSDLLWSIPKVRARVLKKDADSGKRRLFADDQKATMAPGPFKAALRVVFGCGSGHLESWILEWLKANDCDIGEFISRGRAAMALAALRSASVRPDLIILDEFHRYADLILPRPPDASDQRAIERAHVHGVLAEALLSGPHRPAVLLLSATPYRLRTLDGEELHPSERYKSLVDLVGFLSDSSDARAEMLERTRAYHQALVGAGQREDVIKQVGKCKSALERLLRPLMARTERAIADAGDLFTRDRRRVAIEADDLAIFAHLAGAVTKARPNIRGWAPALWSSVPYPAQTLHGYGLWSHIKNADLPRIVVGGSRTRSAHPQMRELERLVGRGQGLALPWQRSTLPWWKLEGPWTDDREMPSGKTLLFSRYRAAPTSVSALLSMSAAPAKSRRSKRRISASSKATEAPLLRPGGSSSGPLIGLFSPWPNLSHAIEPAKSAETTLPRVRSAVRAQLRAWLESKDLKISGSSKRAPWILAMSIELALGKPAFSKFTHSLRNAHIGHGRTPWSRIAAIGVVSEHELTSLADYLLSAPGALLARCARRHGIPTVKDDERRALFEFLWFRLRPYFGNRVIARLILAASRHHRYPDAVADAVLKGGLEAVLDEQLSVLRAIGDKHGKALLTELSGALPDRSGSVRIRKTKTRDRRVTVHAAVPFAGGEQRSGRRSGKLRSDSLRRAFNSPFWPHVLSTTSVGQEGLDFHVWCDRIVHWDLPTDPVDFEQREGRIARYASLNVRRSLARKFGGQALTGSGGDSPYSRMLVAARGQKDVTTGLETWWLSTDDRPVSVTFDWKFSVRTTKMTAMLDDLMYYRLGLGQPEPERFVEMLKKIHAPPDVARSLAIDLSAIGPDLKRDA